MSDRTLFWLGAGVIFFFVAAVLDADRLALYGIGWLILAGASMIADKIK